MSLENDQQQRIQDHYEDPYHRGRCVRPTHYAETRNEQCGDVIAIELRVIEEQLSEIWFEAEGCQLSQATVSMLCEQLEQKPIDDVKNLSPEQAFQLLDLDVSDDQQECCRIGLAGIQSALESPIDDDMHDPTFTHPNLGDEC